VVWFWDDNLTANRAYIKDLLRAMRPLDKWWLTQASMDIAKDHELLDLMKESGCIGVFFGIESFGQDSLEHAQKQTNKLSEYKSAVSALHSRGICAMAGLISGFDGDTPESIVKMATQLMEIGIDVPYQHFDPAGTLSTTIFRAGPDSRGVRLEFYNGFNVSFHPKRMSHGQLLKATGACGRKLFDAPRLSSSGGPALTRWAVFS
jgi:radical SAM superfamily enzyme YgiQ (UPF0313 family)